MLENIVCMGIYFPQLFSSHIFFSVIYLLVLAWQSIIKLKLKGILLWFVFSFAAQINLNCYNWKDS